MIRAVALAAALLAGGAAHALEFAYQSAPEAIVATGDVVANDHKKFQSFIARFPKRPSLVYLASGGGVFIEGIALGTYLRNNGFATRIGRGQSCASACVFIFVGGVIREVETGGRLGVHMASAMFSEEYIGKLKQILLDRSVPLDTRVQAVVALNEQRAASAASIEARYLVRMGVSLRLMDPIIENLQIQIHWLTRQEMVDYNVVNIE